MIYGNLNYRNQGEGETFETIISKEDLDAYFNDMKKKFLRGLERVVDRSGEMCKSEHWTRHLQP